MASWSEESSYQGAASGATAGAAFGGYGAVVGAAVGFVAGGLIGGSQKDAASKAEEDRQREIQKAIERQNTKDFNTKAQAEQWAMSDIGTSRDDKLQDAKANTNDLMKNVDTAHAKVAQQLQKGVTEENWGNYRDRYAFSKNGKYVKNVDNLILNSKVAQNTLANNEGIIANYEKDLGAPKKY